MTIRATMEVSVGCCGYRYSGWVGNFYPRGTKQDRFLQHYAMEFPAVEVDTTFFAIPSPRIVETWAARVPKDFRFYLRTPQSITTAEFDRRTKDTWERFLDVASHLGDKLGGILFQIPPTARPQSHRERHLQFADTYSLDVPLWMEFRNAAFLETDILQDYLDAGVNPAWSESQFTSRNPTPLTTKNGYLRLMGYRTLDRFDKVYLNRDDDTKWWIDQIDSGRFDTLAVFVSNNYMGHAPTVAKTLRRWIADRPGKRKASKVF